MTKKGKTSLIYKDPRIYAFFMRFLYGRNYQDRFQSIAEEIPDGVKVLDLCCGDCAIYTLVLKDRVHYTGVDINTNFIEHGRRKGINILPLDVLNDELPFSDFTIMQASLYQFIPQHNKIVEKMLDSTGNRVIISEPIKNLSTSNNPVISFIARRSADPGTGMKTNRFTEGSFRIFFQTNYDDLIERFKYVPGKRELLVILNAKNWRELTEEEERLVTYA